jgi:aldose 1-epimerase
MKTLTSFCALVAVFPLFPVRGAPTENYSVFRRFVEGYTTYHLLDLRRRMDLGTVPEIGNFAYEFNVTGKDVLITPESLKAYIEKHWFGWGIPFFAPYANRIDHDYYYFQGKECLLNYSSGNLLRTPSANLALHGLLAFDPHWEVVKTGGSAAEGAFITFRFGFSGYPDVTAQFPFAHVYEVTCRLKDGKLACTTKVSNVGKSVMPVHFGYHPLFRPHGPREEWTLGIDAQRHWPANEALIPTGDTEPTDDYLPGATRTFCARQTVC